MRLKDMIPFYADAIGFVLLSMIVVGVVVTALQPTQADLRNEAVAMGHARYVVDNKGSVSFEWLATQTKRVTLSAEDYNNFVATFTYPIYRNEGRMTVD